MDGPKETEKFRLLKHFTKYCYQQTDAPNQYPTKDLMTETFETCKKGGEWFFRSEKNYFALPKSYTPHKTKIISRSAAI